MGKPEQPMNMLIILQLFHILQVTLMFYIIVQSIILLVYAKTNEYSTVTTFICAFKDI